MKYESPNAATLADVEALAERGHNDTLSAAIIGLALNDSDRNGVAALCRRLATHADEAVRGNAILGFGHLARRFRSLDDADAIAEIIRAGLADSSAWVRGQADAAADDFEQYTGLRVRR